MNTLQIIEPERKSHLEHSNDSKRANRNFQPKARSLKRGSWLFRTPGLKGSDLFRLSQANNSH
jgi:hypothetical protein